MGTHMDMLQNVADALTSERVGFGFSVCSSPSWNDLVLDFEKDLNTYWRKEAPAEENLYCACCSAYSG